MDSNPVGLACSVGAGRWKSGDWEKATKIKEGNEKTTRVWRLEESEESNSSGTHGIHAKSPSLVFCILTLGRTVALTASRVLESDLSSLNSLKSWNKDPIWPDWVPEVYRQGIYLRYNLFEEQNMFLSTHRDPQAAGAPPICYTIASPRPQSPCSCSHPPVSASTPRGCG